MRPRLPDFIIVGAMKSATTTLHEQLARQPGVFMTRPKEPNFFSDDDVFTRGFDWYGSLFEKAGEWDLLGESSTHYTKLPDYPRTVERMAAAVPGVKVVYVMRHPIERLLSHYGHEVTNGRTTLALPEAVDRVPGLIDYGCYARQLAPYLDAFGPGNVLPVFFRRLVRHPQEELERIGRFLGSTGRPTWDTTLEPQNVGRQRLRRSPLREALVQAPILTPLRQRLVPKRLSEPIKRFWWSGVEPPPLSPELSARLRDQFDEDLARLGDWLGVDLTCENFRDVTDEPLEWAARP